MSSLFIVGNINEYTFANAVVAAHVKDQTVGGRGLTDVFVLHSPESEKCLSGRDEWREHLLSVGIRPDVLTSCTVELHGADRQQVGSIGRHVERFLLSLDKRVDIYVDLTNGSSLYKSVMSNIAYVLGVRRPFIIDTPHRGRFLSQAEALSAYVELPDPSVLDAVAPAWLTEIRRFSVQARDAAKTLAAISGASVEVTSAFEGDLQHAVDAWFRGVKHDDGPALGGAVRHIGRAFEDLVKGVYEATATTNKTKSLHEMLSYICAHINGVAPDYEPQLLEDVSQLLRRLRNWSTHERTRSDFGRIRARLSTELLLATLEYFRILNSNNLLRRSSTGATSGSGQTLHGTSGEMYFFGIDGDDTGRELERLFQASFDAESFSRFSNAVDAAVRAIAERVLQDPIRGNVLFCSGDDILFRGTYDATALDELRATYARISGGHTCSIGFGRTPKEAYVALKMAKAAPGKDSIVGVQLAPATTGSG